MTDERITITPDNFPADGIIKASGPVSLWGLTGGYHIRSITINAGRRTGKKKIQLLQDSECEGLTIDNIVISAEPDQNTKQSWMDTDFLGVAINSPNVNIDYLTTERVHIPLKLLGKNSCCNYLNTTNTSGDGFQVCGDGSELNQADIHGLLDVYPYEMDHSDVGMLFPIRGRKVLKDAIVQNVKLHKTGHKWEHPNPQGILAPDDSLLNCLVADCELYGVHEEHGVRFGHAMECTVSNVKTNGDIAFGCRKDHSVKGFGNQVINDCEARQVAFEDGSQKNATEITQENNMFDRELFYNIVRDSLFSGMLLQPQVDGMNAIFNAWDSHNKQPMEWIAYSLATTYHETGDHTGPTMQPIKEMGGYSYFQRMYDIEGERPYKAKELGNLTPGDGAMFCGRGFVQLTGRSNYQSQGDKHNIDLINDPDLMLTPGISAAVLVSGMVDGDFTGKGFNDYTSGLGFDAVNARRIINGTDKASLIAGYYEKFLYALEAAKAENKATYSPVDKPEPATQHQTHEPKDMEAIIKTMMSDGLVQMREDIKTDLLKNVTIKAPEDMTHYHETRDGAITPEVIEPVPGEQPNRLQSWLSGKKTHLGMLVSGGIGIAGMFGLVPGISAEAGANMLQSAFAISGTRSAIPKLLVMGLTQYAKARAK